MVIEPITKRLKISYFRAQLLSARRVRVGKGCWALCASGIFSNGKAKNMKAKKWLAWGVFVAIVIALMTGCGGGRPTSTTPPAQSGSIFVNATDAPLPSVVSFQVDITGMTV